MTPLNKYFLAYLNQHPQEKNLNCWQPTSHNTVFTAPHCHLLLCTPRSRLTKSWLFPTRPLCAPASFSQCRLTALSENHFYTSEVLILVCLAWDLTLVANFTFPVSVSLALAHYRTPPPVLWWCICLLSSVSCLQPLKHQMAGNCEMWSAFYSTTVCGNR